MTKNTALTRATMIIGLFVSVFGLGSCTKNVTNRVDQVFSAVYTIEPGDWKVDTYTGGTNAALNQYAANLSVPEIDDRVVLDGGVMVYLSFDNGAHWDELPTLSAGVTYNTIHSKGNLYIGLNTADGSAVDLPNFNVQAKVVILDASALD